MIIKCSCDIESSIFKDLTQEQWAEIRSVLPELAELKPDHYWGIGESLVEIPDACPILDKYKISITLKPFVNNYMLGGGKDLQSVQQRLKKMEDDHQLVVQHINDGKHVVSIHVANIGLLAIREVTNLDDACTDMLQDYLNKGWSILAVCPPNGQRRPDYILGRSSNVK